MLHSSRSSATSRLRSKSTCWTPKPRSTRSELEPDGAATHELAASSFALHARVFPASSADLPVCAAARHEVPILPEDAASRRGARGRVVITWFRRLLRHAAPTPAEREAAASSLRHAGIRDAPARDVNAVALAARRALSNPTSVGALQAELGEAGVTLSATPPTAYALLRRFAALGA